MHRNGRASEGVPLGVFDLRLRAAAGKTREIPPPKSSRCNEMAKHSTRGIFKGCPAIAGGTRHRCLGPARCIEMGRHPKYFDTAPPHFNTYQLNLLLRGWFTLCLAIPLDLKWPDAPASSFGVSGHFITPAGVSSPRYTGRCLLLP